MLRSLALLLVVAAAVAGAERPTPATIHTGQGKPVTGFVVVEGFDQVTWSQDERATAKGTVRWSNLSHIEYSPVSDVNYSRGIGFASSKNHEAAIKSFDQTAKARVGDYWKIQAAFRKAESLVALDRIDEALDTLKGVIAEFGQWVQSLEARERQAAILVAAGRFDEARALFKHLASKAQDFGHFSGRATTSAAVGEATILARQEQFDRAAAALGRALSGLDPNQDGNLYARVALELGRVQAAQGEHAAAARTFADLRYRAVPEADRAVAHLGLAQALDANGERLRALDAACQACVLDGAAPDVSRDARSLAQRLLQALGKDETIDPVERAEYREYKTRL